jgi:hypothetical protein
LASRSVRLTIHAMISENSDIVALTAQADIHRLYVRVIQPALAEFAPSGDVVGETTDIDEYLEGARINTHNSLCHELRRTFALVLGALFERQLRSWLAEKLPTEKKRVEKANWSGLIELLDHMDSSIRVNVVMTDLESLWSVSNAVRHGNGPSADNLLQKAPQYWDQTRMRPDMKRDLVGNMRIDDAQLERYAKAVMKFWHLVGASSPD